MSDAEVTDYHKQLARRVVDTIDAAMNATIKNDPSYDERQIMGASVALADAGVVDPADTQRRIDAAVAAETERNKGLAQKLLAIRDALVEDDLHEAYYVLYSIACPGFDSCTPWESLEQARANPTPEGGG